MTSITQDQIREAFENKLLRGNYSEEDSKQARQNWSSYELNKCWAQVYFNGEVFILSSFSSLGGHVHTQDLELHCKNDVSDEKLGGLLFAVLADSPISTFHALQPEADLITLVDRSGFYQKWLERQLHLHKYKNKKALFLNMLSCSVIQYSDTTIFQPTNHYKLESWNKNGLLSDGNDNIIVPSNSSNEDLGETLRLTFGKCIDSYGDKQCSAEKKADPLKTFDRCSEI